MNERRPDFGNETLEFLGLMFGLLGFFFFLFTLLQVGVPLLVKYFN
jgi:hypothetical protein